MTHPGGHSLLVYKSHFLSMIDVVLGHIKTIFDGDTYVSVDVLKGGGGKEDPHGVDGITGGTITSVGVGEMSYRSLDLYVPYFSTVK